MEKAVPAFREIVLVKRRKWRIMDMEGTHKKAYYVAPAPNEHGHTLLREDGSMLVAPYSLAHPRAPPKQEGTWLAILELAMQG